MFGIMEAANALQWAMAMREHERESEKRFAESIAHLPPEQQAMAIKLRQDAKEKLAKEAEIERRHQELCRAIRESRPRGIGLFF